MYRRPRRCGESRWKGDWMMGGKRLKNHQPAAHQTLLRATSHTFHKVAEPERFLNDVSAEQWIPLTDMPFNQPYSCSPVHIEFSTTIRATITSVNRSFNLATYNTIYFSQNVNYSIHNQLRLSGDLKEYSSNLNAAASHVTLAWYQGNYRHNGLVPKKILAYQQK